MNSFSLLRMSHKKALTQFKVGVNVNLSEILRGLKKG